MTSRLPWYRQFAVQILGMTLAATLAVFCSVGSASAQSGVEVFMRDTVGYPGQTLYLPVILNNYVDTVEGFRINYVMDRPNVAFFSDATPEFDTTIVCVDPPWCTVQDTIIDTFPRVLLDTAGTLISGWDFVTATNLGFETQVRVVAMSNIDANPSPVGISPLIFGQHLVSIAVSIQCHPDPFVGDAVEIFGSLFDTDFSNEQGNLITPVSLVGATISVLPPVPGDQDFSGFVDAIDLSAFIECVFFGGCPACDAVQVDFNCDGQPDSIDLSELIDYVFFGAANLTSCP